MHNTALSTAGDSEYVIPCFVEAMPPQKCRQSILEHDRAERLGRLIRPLSEGSAAELGHQERMVRWAFGQPRLHVDP
jgi:hypothetical protein